MAYILFDKYHENNVIIKKIHLCLCSNCEYHLCSSRFFVIGSVVSELTSNSLVKKENSHQNVVQEVEIVIINISFLLVVN